MKRVYIAFITILMILCTFPAEAKLKLGVKGGVNVSELKLSGDFMDNLSVSNKVGFFVGPTLKLSLGGTGIGFDLAALYDQREAEIAGQTIKHQFVNVPLNLRYNIGLGSAVGIYLAAGPQFGFNIGDGEFELSAISNTSQYTLRSSDFSVNLGGGIYLFDCLEVGVTYNIPCGRTADLENISDGFSTATDVIKEGDSKLNTWRISAALYF